MTAGEKASVGLNATLLALLLIGGWLASNWRQETQDALRQIADAQERSAPVKSGVLEWTVKQPNREPVRLSLDIFVGETDSEWNVRVDDALRRAEVIR